MTLYHIVTEGWCGCHYSPDGVLTFSTEEKRDAVLERLQNAPSYKKGNVSYSCFESELDEG